MKITVSVVCYRFCCAVSPRRLQQHSTYIREEKQREGERSTVREREREREREAQSERERVRERERGRERSTVRERE